jgi:hypothetical protein
MSANDVPISVDDLRYADPNEALPSQLGQKPQTHDHLCGPDPAWQAALEGSDA